MKNERVVINEMLCRKVQLMIAGGAGTAEVAEIVGVSQTTVSRIRRAGYSAKQYEADKNKRVNDARKKPEEQAEDQVPGQIEMELIEKTEKQEYSDTTKMMRFQASQIDKLALKLDHINDTLSMILRVMRKE